MSANIKLERSMATKRLVLSLAIALTVSGCAMVPKYSGEPSVSYQVVKWSQIDGWTDDSTQEAWGAFLNSCKARGTRREWIAVCAAARGVITDPTSTRNFFETHFSPYRLQRDRGTLPRDTGLITGYYEPLLHGAREPASTYTVPLYTPPDDLLTVDLASLYPELEGKTLRGRLQGKKVVPYYSRAELDSNRGLLHGKELVWVDSVLDAFYLQVQGSGRVQLTNGEVIRLAYADQNGHPYRSIGRYLVDQGEMLVEQANAQGIRDWMEAHPQRIREVLNANPSVVFFHEEKIVDPSEGPRGALAIPLTPGRSLAIDPRYIPLGAPVFLSTTYPATNTPLHRLMMAQDTGGAIKGIVRADFFWGFGQAASQDAGRMRQNGRMWLLWPKGQPLPGGK